MSEQALATPVLRVTVNGEAREFPGGTSVAALLAQFGRHPRTVALERNGAIVPRARFDDTFLTQGDRIEIVAFAQGG